MININEYLLDKGKTKKYNVDRPKHGCDVQDIIAWLDSFGVENWYDDHSCLDPLEEGNIGYQISSGSWGNKCVSLDIPYGGGHVRQSIVVYPKIDRNYVSWGYGSIDKNISWDKAIELMEDIMENPRETKILKREEL